jgi:hypothetical protein
MSWEDMDDDDFEIEDKNEDEKVVAKDLTMVTKSKTKS